MEARVEIVCSGERSRGHHTHMSEQIRAVGTVGADITPQPTEQAILLSYRCLHPACNTECLE